MSSEDRDQRATLVTVKAAALSPPESTGNTQACLVVIYGGELGRRIPLDSEPVECGRSPNVAIPIDDDAASRKHARIRRYGDTFVVTDLGSTNGTKLGGSRVESIALAPGASFQLGNVDCVFIGDGEEADYSAPTMTVNTPSSAGYGAHPYDRNLRQGFGPKAREKSSGGGILNLLGIAALLACGAAAYFASQLGAS